MKTKITVHYKQRWRGYDMFMDVDFYVVEKKNLVVCYNSPNTTKITSNIPLINILKYEVLNYD